MYLNRHAAQAVQLLTLYKAPEPMHLFLNSFFKANKKFGSKDRKNIANMVYAILRLGYIENITEEYALQAYEILMQAQNIFSIENTISFDRSKFTELSKNIESNKLATELSTNIDAQEFYTKLLIKPFVFIKWMSHVPPKIEQAYAQVNFDTIAFTADVKLQELLPIEADYIIQDANSQNICNLFNVKDNTDVWDCCCASGGKAIALMQKAKNITLTASDIRPQILKNFKDRLGRYGKRAKHMHVIDLQDEANITRMLGHQTFDDIICDVPCSGSGTWARTPEQYFFADKTQLNAYPELQLNIAKNASAKLKPGGTLHYITCSAFKQENEDVIERLLASNPKLKLDAMKVFSGMETNSDYMFYCRLMNS
jgi:16S rRNA (cytosine967-C5)-methyltransferase